MFVYATKLTARKAVAGLLALAAVIGGVYLLRPGAETTAASGGASLSQKLETNEKRVEFLQSYGWEIDPTPVSETEVLIPEAFDETYAQYNELQKTQGLDLEDYKGRKATLYVYRVYNDPSGEEGVTANLVLYRSRLIAADVCSPDKDGFLRAVTERPAENSQE